MSLEEMAGEQFGPYDLQITAANVSAYVDATGDDPQRWVDAAPPGYAGALLFVAAPHFLGDARVAPFTGVLVHVDQTFAWHAPLRVGVPLSVTGRVARVRERGGRYFVTFSAKVTDTTGEVLVDAVSTFLMGEGTVAGSPDDREEPPVRQRAGNAQPELHTLTGGGAELPILLKSASRLDLVKYAAVSGDFNPIHFDHRAARGAGLDGIVVHGLLMGAWAMQAVTTLVTRPDPLERIKLRFRNPLRPAVQAAASGRVGDLFPDSGTATVAVAVTAGDVELLTAACVLRLGG